MRREIYPFEADDTLLMKSSERNKRQSSWAVISTPECVLGNLKVARRCTSTFGSVTLVCMSNFVVDGIQLRLD